MERLCPDAWLLNQPVKDGGTEAILRHSRIWRASACGNVPVIMQKGSLSLLMLLTKRGSDAGRLA